MFTFNNPQKTLILELEKSKDLYNKLYHVCEDNPYLQNQAYKNIVDIQSFIEYIESLTASELKELINH